MKTEKNNPLKQRSWAFGMAFLVFLGVFILGPRLEGPRYIHGVRFTAKSGGNGLTNTGWILLIALPILAFLLTQLLFYLRQKSGK